MHTFKCKHALLFFSLLWLLLAFPSSLHIIHTHTLFLQLEAKTNKLKKVFKKLQSVKEENNDLKTEFQKEREDMLDTIRDLNKQLKLKSLLLESFVPIQDIERVS